MNSVEQINHSQELELKINQWLDSQGIIQSLPEEKKFDQFNQFRQKAFSLNKTDSYQSSESDSSETDNLSPKSPSINLQIGTSPLLQKRKKLFGNKFTMLTLNN